MHRHTLSLLAALWALAGCQKSSPVGASPPPAPLRPEASRALPAPSVVADAGPLAADTRAAPAVVLGLSHVDRSEVNHLAQARARREEGDTLGALNEARRQLADAPQDEEALEMVARAAQSLREPALAAEAYEELAAVREDDAEPLIQAARMHLLVKDSAGAARLATLALQRDEGSVEAYQALGRAALLDGDLRHAMEWLEQARILAPAHGWVLNNLGFAYLRANENAKALETLARAAELLPASAVVHNNLGVALERAGKTAEASAAFETSAALAPGYTRALVNRARLAMVRTTDGGQAPEPEEDGDAAEE